jgi:hypothetical protein
MENNIFFKLKKDKYNPDIEPALKNIENERSNTKFNLSTNIYNPITGVVPNRIINSNDLILPSNNNNVDFKTLLNQKNLREKYK